MTDYWVITDIDQAHAVLNIATDSEQIDKAIDFIAENTPGVNIDSNDFKLGYLQSTLACTNKKLAKLEEIVSLIKGMAYDGPTP